MPPRKGIFLVVCDKMYCKYRIPNESTKNYNVKCKFSEKIKIGFFSIFQKIIRSFAQTE